MSNKIYVRPHTRKYVIRLKPKRKHIEYWEEQWNLINKYAKPGAFVGEIHASLSELESIFGKPSTAISPDGKVTTSWLFVFPKEKAYIEIYDWKSTSRYESGYPTPTEFRNFVKYNEYDWHVGSNLTPSETKRLLEKYFGEDVAKKFVID